MTERLGLSPSRILAIAAGGALGTLARHGLGEAFPVRTGTFPWTTLAENVGGAFLLAVVVVVVIDRWSPATYLQPFAAVGFCGGFTTYSALVTETVLLVRDGDGGAATAYVIATLVLAAIAVAVGIRVARALEAMAP